LGAQVFISYARSTEAVAEAAAAALRAEGYEVWRDDALPAHRPYDEVIAERLDRADAVLVLWSADAVQSQWVRSEANRARERRKLVQARLGRAALPMPFDQIQVAELGSWTGDPHVAGWRKVVASLAEITAGPTPPPRLAAPAAVAADRPSIAVLPFATPSGGPDEAAFADGMVDEIVTALSRFPSLVVIGSRSSLSYRGDARSETEIARELGVRFLLDGSVRRAGDRLRIAVRLVDGVSGAQVWAERFDGAAGDVFDLQEQVAIAAAAQIAPSIETADIRRALARPTQDLTAYELYLRAVHLQRAFTREALEEGIAAVDLALDRDPHFAPALAFASLLHSLLVLCAWADDPAETRTRALNLARRALNSGPENPESMAMIATVLIWVGEDAKAADAMVERALSRNPGAALIWFASAWIKTFDGRPALALEHFDRHMVLDPRSPLRMFVAGGTGVALTLLGRFGEGAARLGEALQQVPDHTVFRTILTVALALGGDADAARPLAERLPAGAITNTLALLQNPADRERVREGLGLAGARD